VGDHLSGRLDDVLQLVGTDPGEALAAADAWLTDTHAEPAERSSAWWARGLALREMARATDSLDSFEHAVSGATEAGLVQAAARYRVSLSLALAEVGQFDRALMALDDALVVLEGSDASAGHAQRALLLMRAGRLDESLPQWDRAVRDFVLSGDGYSEGMALLNRGTTRSLLGRYRAAMADMESAEARFVATGAVVRAAETVHNRGFVAGRLGDTPTALRLMDQAQQELTAAGVASPIGLIDRVEVLVGAGLGREALSVAEVAAQRLAETGLEAHLAELSLLAARAAETAPDLAAAKRWARQAETFFATQGRTRWQVIARFAQLRLAANEDVPSPECLAEMRRELLGARWLNEAVDAALLEIRSRLPDDVVGARWVLTDTRRQATSVSRTARSRLWLGEALVRLAEGRRSDALRAVRAGVRMVEAIQDGLTAVDLRLAASAKMAALTELGASIAWDAGPPSSMFGWLEWSRIGATRVFERPPDIDDDIGPFLEQLRVLHAHLEAQEIGEREAPRLRRRVNALEEVVRRHLRHGVADGARALAPVPPRELLARLGDHRRLVEFGVVRGELVALIAASSGWKAIRLSSVVEATALVDTLRHAALESVTTAPSSTGRAHRLIAELAERADRVILGPVGDLGDDELVIVPAGPLHTLPWALLPSLATRAFVVAPSASAWATASGDPARPLIAILEGPSLQSGDREVSAVAAAHGGRASMYRQAGIDDALSAVATADVVHFACHGSFRPDNPQFSSLRLRDGPLSALELARVARQPLLYVLSSCDSALAVAEGGGTLGVASLLLAAGARAVVASVTPADDEHAPSFMAEFHHHLALGMPAESALVSARVVQPRPWLLGGFAVYGSSVRLDVGAGVP
jgi:hypothetical protein